MAERVEFDQFVAARSQHLVRLAYLMTRDPGAAQDITQTALANSWFAWKRITGDPEAYVRRTLINAYLTTLRRPWRRELATDPLPDSFHADVNDELLTRMVLWEALRRLPRRQRAVVVLRYFEDLTESQVAEILGCTVGSVKSHTSRALARLRVDEELHGAAINEPAASTRTKRGSA